MNPIMMLHLYQNVSLVCALYYKLFTNLLVCSYYKFLILSDIGLFQESCRFIEHATNVVQNIGNVVTSFNELSTNNKHTILDLGVKDQPQNMQERHYQAGNFSLLRTRYSQLSPTPILFRSGCGCSYY